MRILGPFAHSRQSQLWLTATLVILAQGVFILYSRRHDYFFLDDFLGFIVAHTTGLTFTYLTHDVFGQFAPGYRLTDFLYTYVIGLHYFGVRLFDIFTVGSASTLMLILAREWRVRLAFVAPVMAFIPYSPIFSVTFQWFSAALHVLPSMALGIASLVCLGSPMRLGWERRLGGALLFACGLLFYAKTLFLSVLLFALRVFTAIQRGQAPVAATRQALGELIFCIPVGIAYLSIVILGHYSSGTPPGSIGPVLDFVRIGFVDGFCANLFGIDPAQPWARVLACILVLVPILASSLRNPRAMLIWAGFAAQFVLATAAIAYGRVVGFGAESAALSRYHAEMAVFFLACVLICFGRTKTQEVSFPQTKRTVTWNIAGLAAASAIVAVLVRASLTAPLLYPPDDGRIAAYISNFRQSLQDVGCSKLIVDGTVPDWVMASWTAPLNHLHDLALLFPPGPRFTSGSDATIEIDQNGRLKPLAK
jgi:hypothetical protein